MLPGPNTSEGAHAAQQMSVVPQKPDLIGQVRDRQQCANCRRVANLPNIAVEPLAIVEPG